MLRQGQRPHAELRPAGHLAGQGSDTTAADASMTYRLRTDQTWSQTNRDLNETFRKWGVHRWESDSDGRRSSSWTLDRATRMAYVHWTTADGREMRLEMADQDRPVDNYRVLYLAIEAMRLNEARGIGKVLQEAYAQLAAPKTAKDPFEVLGVRPDTSLDDIEAMFRIKAKKAHPDAGGSEQAMAELNEAITAIRAQVAA